jgi:hypothetical protein
MSADIIAAIITPIVLVIVFVFAYFISKQKN